MPRTLDEPGNEEDAVHGHRHDDVRVGVYRSGTLRRPNVGVILVVENPNATLRFCIEIRQEKLDTDPDKDVAGVEVAEAEEFVKVLQVLNQVQIEEQRQTSHAPNGAAAKSRRSGRTDLPSPPPSTQCNVR